MSAKGVLTRALLVPALLAALAVSAGALGGPAPLSVAKSDRLLFAGDILLSRQVWREILARHGASPWAHLSPLFRQARWVVGNLEGAVGDRADCNLMPGADPNLCFAVPPAATSLLRDAGFGVIGVENNHGGDLGPAGRARTQAVLTANGLLPLDFDGSPMFLQLGDRILALVPLTLVPQADGRRSEVPSTAVRQKLALAGALADWVVVFVHWGTELTDWPGDRQREQAAWLVEHGADVVIGHHPHVVQAPVCLHGHPVFYSLGNHVFDQKYPLTKTGLLADCGVSGGRLVCGAISTHTPEASAYPELIGPTPDSAAFNHALAACPVPPRPPLTIGGITVRPRLDAGGAASGDLVLTGSAAGRVVWRSPPRSLLLARAAAFSADGSGGIHPYLVTLEQHYSPLDQETSPRPYVYAVTPHGLVAKWRGSALAWPLRDIETVRGGDGSSVLCALHRGDSFISLNPATPSSRLLAYRWNGFGFTAAGADAAVACTGMFPLPGT